jgi:hypothetical protein
MAEGIPGAVVWIASTVSVAGLDLNISPRAAIFYLKVRCLCDTALAHMAVNSGAHQ